MRALMALVNLTGRCDYEHAHDRTALGSLVQVLDSTLDDGCWAGLRLGGASRLGQLDEYVMTLIFEQCAL